MGTPFEDFEDLHGSTPAKIVAAANQPGVSATMLSSLSTDLLQDAAKSDAATIGDLKSISQLPKTAAGHAQTLAAAGNLAAGCLRQFGAQATTFDAEVAKLNLQVLNAGTGLMHTPEYKMGELKIDFAQMRQDETNRLRPEYNRLLHQLDHDAAENARILKAGPGDLANIKALIRAGFIPLAAASDWPTLVLTDADRAAYYAAVTKDMTAAERATYLLQHKEISAPVLDILLRQDKETATEIVNHANDLVTQINQGKYTDLKPTLTDLNAYLSRFGDVTAIAAPLMNKIGPDGLLRLNQIVAQSDGDMKPDPYSNKDGGPRDNALGALIGDLQKNLGTTLATASGGPNGYAPGTPEEYRLASDYVDRLNELGQKKTDITWPGEDDYHYGAQVYGYQVLAPLLRTGHFNPDFLDPIAEGMYSFDRYHGDGNGSVWGTTTMDLRPDHGIRLDWTQGTGSTHSAGFDPLQGLMDALGNNPQSAHDFFTGERSYTFDGSHGWDETHGYNDKLRYLLNERQWNLPYDQPYRGDGTDSDGYYDKHRWEEQNNTHDMDPLGRALSAATSGNDQESATLFGDVVHEVANGDNTRYGDLRDDFATMATQHLGAVNAGFVGDGGPGTDGDVDPFTPGVQHDPGFSKNDNVDLEKYLAEIGRDPDAKNSLTAAEALYMQAGYRHGMTEVSGTLDDRMLYLDTRINNPLGHVLGALDYGDSDQKWGDHVTADQEHNDAIDQKYALIGFLTDKLPFDKIPVGGDLVKSGVEGWLDALKDSEHVDTSAVANSLIGSLHSGSENHIQSTAEATLLANLTEKDRAELGLQWPTDAHGNPKPLDQWTAADRRSIDQQFNNNAQLAKITKFGTDSRSSYAQAFDDAKTDIQSHGG